jgi:hypothetical protein
VTCREEGVGVQITEDTLTVVWLVDSICGNVDLWPGREAGYCALQIKLKLLFGKDAFRKAVTKLPAGISAEVTGRIERGE